MDTIKILLTITSTLLFAALVWNISQQKAQKTLAPKEEIARIEKQLEAIAIEEKFIENEKRLRSLGLDVLGSARQLEQQQASAAKSLAEEQAREAAEAAAKLQELETKESEKKLNTEEQGIVDLKQIEKTDKEFRNSNLISQALVMARVTDSIDDPDLGTFVLFDIKIQEQVKEGTLLALRRKNGIAGFVRVTSVTGVEGVADILPGVGKFTPQVGDDLIMDPIQ